MHKHTRACPHAGARTQTHSHTGTQARTQTHWHASTHARTHAHHHRYHHDHHHHYHPQANAHARAHVRTHAHRHTRTRTRTRSHTHARARAHTHTHTHIHAHTHQHQQRCRRKLTTCTNAQAHRIPGLVPYTHPSPNGGVRPLPQCRVVLNELSVWTCGCTATAFSVLPWRIVREFHRFASFWKITALLLFFGTTWNRLLCCGSDLLTAWRSLRERFRGEGNDYGRPWGMWQHCIRPRVLMSGGERGAQGGRVPPPGPHGKIPTVWVGSGPMNAPE